jgi:hypothetical protein
LRSAPRLFTGCLQVKPAIFFQPTFLLKRTRGVEVALSLPKAKALRRFEAGAAVGGEYRQAAGAFAQELTDRFDDDRTEQ